jgi:hypothetical protein
LIEDGAGMSILFRVGQMIMAVMFTIWLLFGFGVSWVAWKAKSDMQSSGTEISGSSDTASRAEERAERRRAAQDRMSENEREYRREREGVNIDSGSARPMVDVDPSHRY